MVQLFENEITTSFNLSRSTLKSIKIVSSSALFNHHLVRTIFNFFGLWTKLLA